MTRERLCDDCHRHCACDQVYDSRAEIARLRSHIKKREDHYAGLLAVNEAEIARLRAQKVCTYPACRETGCPCYRM